jgi:hypothetical protein
MAESRRVHLRELTLKGLMGAIAASAFLFALRPMPFAAALAVAVCGAVVLDGMDLPVVSEPSRYGALRAPARGMRWRG